MKKIEKSNSQVPLFLRKPEGAEFSPRLPSSYSPPILAVEGKEKFPLLYSADVNMTIRLKISEFSRKQATILAGQAILEVSQGGISLTDWLILEFLYSYLLGQKQEAFELKDSKEFELTLLLKVILSSVSWIELEGYEQLPQDVLSAIETSKWIPSLRTYQSRRSLYSLNRYFAVRFVPIDDLMERRSGTTRYSSYCKGYGESSRMGRRQKTRPSAELDGEPVDLEKERLINLPLSRIGEILNLVMLETKYALRKRR
jgi:hypothetical protein